jgi:hypothetical protein
MSDKTKKVRLVSAANSRRSVTFRASPQVTENRNVNYAALEPLHAPGQVQVYKNTASRSFSISDLKLISRTAKEATDNLKILWRLRSWTMPRFGNSSTLNARERSNRNDPLFAPDVSQYDAGMFNSDAEFRQYAYGTELLGAPPEVLYLSAYSMDVGYENAGVEKPGTAKWKIAQHLNRIPVVIQQLTIPYPNDVDYINTVDGVAIPIIMNLDISLIETHSPNSYSDFSLDDFRAGRLKGF